MSSGRIVPVDSRAGSTSAKPATASDPVPETAVLAKPIATTAPASTAQSSQVRSGTRAD